MNILIEFWKYFVKISRKFKFIIKFPGNYLENFFAAANTEIRQEAASDACHSASHFPLLQAGAFDLLAFNDILFKRTSTYPLLTSAGLRLFSFAKVILAALRGLYGLVDSRASPFSSCHFYSVVMGFPSRMNPNVTCESSITGLAYL